MVTGEINMSTCYGEAVIPVELLDIGPRPGTVWVRALNGLEPFTRVSHGGPFQDDTVVWSIPKVLNVHTEDEEEHSVEVDLEQSVQPELESDQAIPVDDWFLEMAYEDRTYID
jgi:hypothetical protein